MALRPKMNQLAAALLLLTPLLGFAQPQSADLILIHGRVLSVDAHDSVAQAIAVRRGVILKVGSDSEVRALAAPNAQVIDLKGRTATPGLIDTHAHIAEGGVDELYGVKLSDAGSMADIAARVKAKVSMTRPGDWILFNSSIRRPGSPSAKLTHVETVFPKDRSVET